MAFATSGEERKASTIAIRDLFKAKVQVTLRVTPARRYLTELTRLHDGYEYMLFPAR